MTSVERAEQQYENAVSAARGRHNALLKRAADDHTKAIEKARGTYELAVRAADERLADAEQDAARALPRVLRAAEEALDAACRNALGVPTVAYLHEPAPGRVELRTSVGGTPLATATDEGAGRWVLTTEVERRFLGSGLSARVELWRYAATLAAPAVTA